jgi:PAS domain S-box-containing protein
MGEMTKGTTMQNLLERILDTICKGTWVVDKDEIFIYFDKGMEEITGIKSEEVIDKKLEQYMSASRHSVGDEAHFREMFLRAKDSLKPIPYKTMPIVTKGGNLSFQTGRLIPLLNQKGNYDGMICTVESVSEQKISQKTLRKRLRSDRKLEEIYKNSPVVAFLWTAEKDWPVEFVSGNISQFGYTPEDFTSGKLIYGDIIYPDDLDMVRSEVSEHEIEGKIFFSKEYRILTKSGEIRWVIERSFIGRDEVGEPSYYQGIIIDITDRKMAEEVMRESEKKYRLIFENSPLGIFHFDENGVITHCNEKFPKIIAASREDIIGFNMVTSIQDEQMRAAVKAALSRKPGYYEGKYLTAISGKLISIKADYNPNISEDGILLGGIGIFEDISDRMKAEEAMRESEKKYRLIFENSPLGIFHFDENGVITHCNENIMHILEMTRDQIIGFNILKDLKDKKMYEAVKAVFLRRSGHYEGKYHSTTSEKVTPIKADYSPYISEDGELLGGVGIVEDISDRMKAEEALHLDESRLETLVKLNQMTEASLKEIIDFARAEGVRLTESKIGYLAFVDEDIGAIQLKSWSDTPMNRCKIKDKKIEYKIEDVGLWGESIRQRRPFINNDYNRPHPRKGGYPKGHVELIRHMDVPIFERGKIVALAGVGNKNENYDSSDVRQLTLLMQGMWRIVQRRKTEKELERSEDKFRTIFASTNDAIFVHDLKGNIMEVNKAACETTGYSRDELLRMKTKEINTSLSMEEIPQRIKEVKEKGHAIFEATYRHKDDTTIPVEISARMIEYNDKPTILVVARDITERKRAEEELRKYAEDLAKANEELKSLDKMKDEFLSNVSHELKTPLTSIMGYTELLNDGSLGELGEEQKHAEETVMRNTKRLQRLVDSLLYLSRTQAGTVQYDFETLNISELADQIIEDLQIQTKEKNLEMIKKIEPNLPQIKGDRDKLTDMFTNIIDNSIKFTPKGGSITVFANKEDGYIHINIKDTGIGIPKDMIDNLFQRFYQIDSSQKRKYGGTGLGLYISKTIVEAHDGEIWVESEGKGKGTEVHIKLPVGEK